MIIKKWKSLSSLLLFKIFITFQLSGSLLPTTIGLIENNDNNKLLLPTAIIQNYDNNLFIVTVVYEGQFISIAASAL